MKRPLLLLPALVLFGSTLACSGGDCVVQDLECPSDAPVLGQDGFYVDSVSSDWTWSEECGGSFTDVFYFQVPDDIVSLSTTVDAGPALVGFGSLFLNGEEQVSWNSWGYEPYYHFDAVAGSVVMPNSENTWPEGGCLVVQGFAESDLEGETAELHVVTRRGESAQGLIDVNIIVLDGTVLYPEELDEALAVMDEVWSGGGGPGVGEVVTYTLDWGTSYVAATDQGMGPIRAVEIPGSSPQAMNIFFISDFTEPGILGMAAGIPGPNGVLETWGSGMMVAVDTHLDGSGEILDTQLMGETMAHEVGHQLGLFHTTEAEGGGDPLADTPECTTDMDLDGDGELTAEECQDADGANFMFWTAGSFRQNEVSATQAEVLYYSPIAR